MNRIDGKDLVVMAALAAAVVGVFALLSAAPAAFVYTALVVTGVLAYASLYLVISARLRARALRSREERRPPATTT